MNIKILPADAFFIDINPYKHYFNDVPKASDQGGKMRNLCRFIAFLLLLTFFTGRIGAVSHHIFVEPIQNYISKKVVVDENSTPRKTILFKGKRNTSELLSTLAIDIPAVMTPALATRFTDPEFRSVPEIYLDIFIPPDPHLYPGMQVAV